VGKWKGAPEVTTGFPVLHQLEAARMIAPTSASECETVAKRSLKKHELVLRRHQNARMEMVERVSTASSMLRVIRKTTGLTSANKQAVVCYILQNISEYNRNI
jgi:hypothetical protein